MSEENVSNAPSNDEEENSEFVPRKALEDALKYKNDMFKYKEEKKKLAAEKNELMAKLNSIEEKELEAQGEKDALIEKLRQERDAALNNADSEKQQTIRFRKQLALKAELGNVKDEYLVHADLDAIELNDDGSLSSESVLSVANSFRENHAGLLPKSESKSITDQAAKTSGPSNYVDEIRNAKSQKEFDAIRRKYGRI